MKCLDKSKVIIVGFLKYIVFLLLMTFSSAWGVIYEVENLLKLEQEVNFLTSSSLVLFDVDYTLLTPKDASLKPCGKALRRKYLHDLDAKRRELLQSIFALEGDEELVDDLFPSMIKKIQEENIPVIALTALETGKYGKIEALEDWRILQLKKFGIDFSNTFKVKSDIVLKKYRICNDKYPLFKSGVLFTNCHPKGEVLGTFFKEIEWTPKKIIFIDDSLAQIKSVELLANSLSIEFVGFHYLASSLKCCNYEPNLGEYQFKILLEKDRWLIDSEAEKILKNIQ